MSVRLKDIRMSLHMECYPCFLRQTLIALDAAGVADPATRHAVMKAVLHDIDAADPARSPSHASTPLHRRIRDMLGLDPFAELKHAFNRRAMREADALRDTVRNSADPLATAARLAIAGNVIDFGIYTSVDIGASIDRALNSPLAVDDARSFRSAIDGAAHVLYLLDNAGEIAFDMLLIEEIMRMGRTVTAVVRGGPILNDVTMADADETGLTRLCRVIANGTDAVGTVLESASEELRALFRAPGAVVVSKGQGNFETLIEERGVTVFYLFQAKCDVVARMLGLPKGAMILCEGPVE